MRLLCRLGFHSEDKDTYIYEKRVNGKHKWHVNYRVCRRCGKKMRRIRIVRGSEVVI